MAYLFENPPPFDVAAAKTGYSGDLVKAHTGPHRGRIGKVLGTIPAAKRYGRTAKVRVRLQAQGEKFPSIETIPAMHVQLYRAGTESVSSLVDLLLHEMTVGEAIDRLLVGDDNCSVGNHA